MNLPPAAAVVLGLTVLAAGGCRTVNGAAPVRAALPAVTKPDAFERIVQGMSADEVRNLVGRPHVVTPTQHGEVNAETWLYLRKLDEAVSPIPIGTREIPAINPITGQNIVIEEPILHDGFTTLYEDFSLLLVDGHVVAIKRRQRVEQEIH